MYVPEKMKVNKFVDVAIPENHDYFARFGYSNMPSSGYTGDKSLTSGNKTDVLAMMDELDRQRLAEEQAQVDSNS